MRYFLPSAVRLKIMEKFPRSRVYLADKYLNLFDIFRRYPARIYIETGLLYGDSLKVAKKAGFVKLYSIEIDESLCKAGRKLFKKSAEILSGHSPNVLKKLLRDIDEPCTFYLDGHPQQLHGWPVLEELHEISKHHLKNHNIILDDRRFFGSGDIPTEVSIIKQIRSINNAYVFKYENGRFFKDILAVSVDYTT